MLIVISLLLNDGLCRLLLANYRLGRCSLVIEMLLLVSYRLRRCSVVVEMLLLANYSLCRCKSTDCNVNPC